MPSIPSMSGIGGVDWGWAGPGALGARIDDRSACGGGDALLKRTWNGAAGERL